MNTEQASKNIFMYIKDWVLSDFRVMTFSFSDLRMLYNSIPTINQRLKRLLDREETISDHVMSVNFNNVMVFLSAC